MHSRSRDPCRLELTTLGEGLCRQKRKIIKTYYGSQTGQQSGAKPSVATHLKHVQMWFPLPKEGKSW